MNDSSPRETAWWLEPPEVIAEELATAFDGLSRAEARRRLLRHGPNVLRERAEVSLAVEFLRRFRNPLVLILIAASIVSALTGEVASFVIITVLVLFSVTLDFVQEYRAGRAAERLRRSVQVHASVVRDGRLTEVPATEVVPRDVVQLAAGDLIPADGILLEARDLHVNQAVLTGEPFPVDKRAGALHEDATELASAGNAVFMGTSVVSGSGRTLVYRTGSGTAIGQVAHSLSVEPPPTAFEMGIRRFGMLIMRLTVLMVLFVLMINVALAKPLLQSFLFAVALAVGLTPELLPMVVSVTLARGALRMAARRVVVKRLAAIENLGSMDVLCTDKTGTLTEAKISLERHVDVEGTESERVLALAYLNSFFETGLKSPLDQAILAHDHLDVKGWQKVDEAPFDFERRRVSVLLEKDGARILVVKGAAEDILAHSTQVEVRAGEAPRVLDAATRARARRELDALGTEGLRALGIAFKPVPGSRSEASAEDETDLTFAGFAAFLDPPKAGAGQALEKLRDSGITVKIVTGDNEVVTQHVCAKLGLPVTGVLTGADIARLDDHALEARADATTLFCRVSPVQKNRIILALRKRGRVVGYLGDGINDAPALHSADVSLSVDSAVDIAKEAADLILTRRDLSVLHDGVLEGRRTFANIRKYIMMGTSSNFGNMFSMAAASLFLPFLPMLPTQILLNNVLYDLSEVAIPLDRVDADELRRPQAWDMAFVRDFMWIIGPLSSLFDFATFYVLLAILSAHDALFQTGWFIESLATQVLVIFVIRTRGSPLTSRPHPALAASSLGVLVLAIALPFSPLGSRFGFEPPPGAFFAILAVLIVAYLAIVEVAKHLFYARRPSTTAIKAERARALRGRRPAR